MVERGAVGGQRQRNSDDSISPARARDTAPVGVWVREFIRTKNTPDNARRHVCVYVCVGLSHHHDRNGARSGFSDVERFFTAITPP